jgi:hypothetical protein
VDGVAEGCAVVFCHFRVAAQNVVVLGILTLVEGTSGGSIGTCIGPAGPAWSEPAGRWFVLICEEGLVPPINTNSSDKCLRQIEATKEKTRGKGV